MNTGTTVRKSSHIGIKMRAIMVLAALALIFAGFVQTGSIRTDPQNNDGVTEKMKTIPDIKMNIMEAANATTKSTAERGELKALNLATAWLNSKPLTSMDLKGKVVLINFWTYTCINWIRTLPYIRAWAEKYQDKGLVIIGVHTPEFAFEKDLENVRNLTRDLGVEFPVAVDNDYNIWNAFNNRYWPALYFIDSKGKVRHQQFGEGKYEQAEKLIRELLAEAGTTALGQPLSSVAAKPIEVAADWENLESPENYLGYQRTEHFASTGGASPDKRHNYIAPEKLMLNQWALAGDWTMQREAVLLNKASGKIRYNFHARDLHMVMGPKNKMSPVRFRVLIDGHAPGADHGTDIDEQGYGILKEQRLYQLLRQKSTVQQHEFEIEFLDAGAEAFSFTFG